MVNFRHTHPKSGLAQPTRHTLTVNYPAALFFAGWATGSVQASILLSCVALIDEPMRYLPNARQ